MHHFSYVGGALHAEGVSLARIAEDVGTPFYCYATAEQAERTQGENPEHQAKLQSAARHEPS